MQKPTKRDLTLYLKHLAFAWPGIFLFCAAAGMLLSTISQRLQFLFDMPDSAPAFAGWLVVGALAGYMLNRRDQTRAACFVFIPALAMLLTDFPSVFHMPVDGGWTGVWTAYFSKNCAASECGNELLMTAPLYACAAYSLAAWAALHRSRGTLDRARKMAL